MLYKILLFSGPVIVGAFVCIWSYIIRLQRYKKQEPSLTLKILGLGSLFLWIGHMVALYYVIMGF